MLVGVASAVTVALAGCGSPGGEEEEEGDGGGGEEENGEEEEGEEENEVEADAQGASVGGDGGDSAPTNGAGGRSMSDP